MITLILDIAVCLEKDEHDYDLPQFEADMLKYGLTYEVVNEYGPACGWPEIAVSGNEKNMLDWLLFCFMLPDDAAIQGPDNAREEYLEYLEQNYPTILHHLMECDIHEYTDAQVRRMMRADERRQKAEKIMKIIS